ncbi:MAG TPA: acylphosphatase [Anaerolineales bacterium]|nr:acylphosphatase [Anaerolineales bacterium]
MNQVSERMTALVSGGVQGVGFRYFVWQQARSLALTGWVRNLHSGSVDVLAEGPRPALEQLAADGRGAGLSTDLAASQRRVRQI